MALATSDDPMRASPQAMSTSCAGISCSDPSIRRGVPTQSLPVSPPPITTTSRPRADRALFSGSPASTARVAGLDRVGASQERLHDGGHASLCGRAKVVRVDGDGAPKEQGDTASGAFLFEDAACVHHPVLIARQKDHRHAVVALCGQDLPAFLRFLAEESMRDLEENARAVTGGARASRRRGARGSPRRRGRRRGL